MTILESLLALTTYPIPNNFIGSTCISRELNQTDILTKDVIDSKNYQLAKADIYMFLFGAPSIAEQNTSVSVVERSNYYDMAKGIYDKYESGSNFLYGFIGEKYS